MSSAASFGSNRTNRSLLTSFPCRPASPTLILTSAVVAIFFPDWGHLDIGAQRRGRGTAVPSPVHRSSVIFRLRPQPLPSPELRPSSGLSKLRPARLTSPRRRCASCRRCEPCPQQLHRRSLCGSDSPSQFHQRDPASSPPKESSRSG